METTLTVPKFMFFFFFVFVRKAFCVTVRLSPLHIAQKSNSYYYIAINITWLKICNKSRETSVPISLHMGTLTWYQLAYSDTFACCRCMTLLWMTSNFYDVPLKIVIRFCRIWLLCYKKLTRNIYCYIIKALLHWYRWTVSLVGISTLQTWACKCP